jgi:hypothetical protein
VRREVPRYKSYIRHPVQKQGRAVPDRRLGQRSRQAEQLSQAGADESKPGTQSTGSPRGPERRNA